MIAWRDLKKMYLPSLSVLSRESKYLNIGVKYVGEEMLEIAQLLQLYQQPLLIIKPNTVISAYKLVSG